jgi:cytochrome c-type biogenesis protein CcmH/NrfF
VKQVDKEYSILVAVVASLILVRVIWLVWKRHDNKRRRAQAERILREKERQDFRIQQSKFDQIRADNAASMLSLRKIILSEDFLIGRCPDCGCRRWKFEGNSRVQQFLFLRLNCEECDFSEAFRSRSQVYPHLNWELANELDTISKSLIIFEEVISSPEARVVCGVDKINVQDLPRKQSLLLGGDFYTHYQITDDHIRTSIPREVQEAVRVRDGLRCVYCGNQSELQFDHIIPVSKGGGNQVENIQLLCRTCNLKKGAGV